jgi:hypothetical protein
VDVYQCSGKTEGQFFTILLTVCGLVDVYQYSGKTDGQFFFTILLTVCGLVDVYQYSGKTEGQFFTILLHFSYQPQLYFHHSPPALDNQIPCYCVYIT